jgi:hypothetical protein
LETEALLLHILPLISSEQLATTVARIQQNPTSQSMPYSCYDDTGGRTQSSRTRKFGVDYWTAFPLGSVEEIRLWVEDHATTPEDCRISNVTNTELGQRDVVDLNMQEQDNDNCPTVETDNWQADLSGPAIIGSKANAPHPQILSRRQTDEPQNWQEIGLDRLHSSGDFMPSDEFVARPLSPVNRTQQSLGAQIRTPNHTPATSRSANRNQTFLPDRFVQEFIW